MYWRLKQTFPDDVVLAQVAFSALITGDTASRNRFARKYADFVLCDRAFNVRAVIELDDSSHRGRAQQDRDRAAMLESAGYKVVRFDNVPDDERLREAIATTATRGQQLRRL